MTVRVFFRYLVAVIIFALGFWGVTYTSDWEGYEYYFNNDLTMKSDLASFLIFNYLRQHHILDYRVAFRVHILLMSLLYPLLFTKLKQNPIPYTVLFVFFFYVPVANQIRYYVAFPLAILSIVYMSKRKIVPSLITGFLAVSFQLTICVLLVVYLAYQAFVIRPRRFSRNLVFYLSGVVLAFLVLPIMSYMPQSFIEDYQAYSNEEALSSFVGGLFTMAPKLLSLAILFSTHIMILRKAPSIIAVNTRLYYTIWSLSVATSVLIPLGFTMQIFVNRFVAPMLVFQVLYLSYVNHLARKIGVSFYAPAKILLILGVTFLWQTVVPYWLHIISTPLDPELLMILNSYSL
jgi:hypothetical protein